MEINPGLSEQLNEGQLLKIASTREEIERIGIFNERIHGEELREYIIQLFEEHPFRDETYWLYIEENNEIISSLTLLKNYWKMGGNDIKIAEMGFVGTDKKHRGKGLYGTLNSYYEKIALEQGMVLSTLRGIPNFYTKRGYSFAITSDMGYAFNNEDIKASDKNTVSFRLALEDDQEYVLNMYSDSFKDQFIYCNPHKSYNYRNFHLKNHEFQDNCGLTYIIIEDNKRIGYFTLGFVGTPKQLDIYSISEVRAEVLDQILYFVKTKNIHSDKFNVYLTDKFKLSELLDSRATYNKGWQWQNKILDFPGMMTLLKKSIEGRLINSKFSDFNENIKISNYKETAIINFEMGKIVSISTEEGYPAKVDLKIPDNLLPKLLLADKTIEEINYMHPDCIYDDKLELLNTIFPKLPSLAVFIY